MHNPLDTLKHAPIIANVAGAAALSICESLLIALNDLDVISDKDAHEVLVDAAASHRNAIPASAEAETHRAVAELIEKIMNGKNSVRKI